MSTIADQVREIIASELKIEADSVTSGSTLEDWGADSLDFLEAIFAIETHFDISFPDDEESRAVSDFDSLVRIVEGEVNAKVAA
ncbi:phosphopantetheine-binding protein [uncultured Abyssibacter sp.]|uniref:phosphopantetheine-binding protein n=1 Tax=uncultured Abyssibacter sp. TaxID=2320202 RepID=UPI0032B24F56